MTSLVDPRHVTHRCVVCPQLRLGEPRIYDEPRVCAGCRGRLRSLLAEIPELYTHLSLERGSNGDAKVSGSRTPPLPLVVDILDLTLPPHRGSVHDDLGDQTGHPSVPAVLDSWCRDWQTYRWALLPEPHVAALTHWLAERLDWACRDHPAVDDFAWEINDLARRMRPRAPRPELKVGVPCRQCDRVTLYRWPGSDRIECGSCPALLTIDEYDRWTQLIAMPAHQDWVRQVVSTQREEIAAG